MGLLNSIGGILGIGGGGNQGATFQPKPAAITPGINGPQIDNAYGQSQYGLNQQQSFLSALQGQNGIGNQANVYNQYQGIANGTGPNPALAQLNNTTGQNIQNQSALMAGQRGTSANAGLLARQAAMQGGALQQQAAGQGAALQAQQQLAALSAMQGIAGQQVGQQAQAGQFYNQAAQSEQQNLLNALAQYNNAQVSSQNNMNTVGGGLAGTVTQGQQGLFGGALNGIAGSLGSLFGGSAAAGNAYGPGPNDVISGNGRQIEHARGGMIQNFDEGGMAQAMSNAIQSPMGGTSGPQSNAGKFLFGSAPSQQTAEINPLMTIGSSMGAGAGAQAMNKAGNSAGSGIGGLLGGVAAGIGSVFGLAEGGDVQGKVPGQAAVQGDSLKNDKVPAMLSPGEVVIPRHIMQSGDPAGNAAKFVQAVMAKQGMRK